MTVALGIARLFEFLHHSNVLHLVHAELSPRILLDQEMNPVLYDIGTTRSGIIQLIEGVEDSCEGSVVPQSDIFSFGVLLMSLICKYDVTEVVTRMMARHVEERYKSKFSLAHESFVNHPLFDEYDGHDLSVLVFKCLGLEYPMTRPTASEIVKQLENLSIFTGTHKTTEVDNDDKVLTRSVVGRKHTWRKSVTCIKRLFCYSSSNKKNVQKVPEGPTIMRPHVYKPGSLSAEHLRIGYLDEIAYDCMVEEAELKRVRKWRENFVRKVREKGLVAGNM
ncbi:probable serine/threonine-protein kinase PBL9 isoform X1 [Spinacia oleracea]|uniref:Probable serine/threonine-protein kinase PBL9 isoform X1 n=1 Tax=Spinacia oleracea TaxID=3562 RepID=A0A9R0J481_SPIOL|nr:probable serine/threonine-protein kinase PBL9 isoform X1 [Spinacia oleracea]